MVSPDQTSAARLGPDGKDHATKMQTHTETAPRKQVGIRKLR
jgi:hypothetical protein